MPALTRRDLQYLLQTDKFHTALVHEHLPPSRHMCRAEWRLSLIPIFGSSILGALPESVVLALNNILPALFGAMLAQQFVANPKIGSIAVVLAGGMFALYRLGFLSFLPGTPTYAIIIVSVFGTILIGRKVTKTAALTGDDET